MSLAYIFQHHLQNKLFTHAYCARGSISNQTPLVEYAHLPEGRDVFDLASLTKALVTTALVFAAIIRRGLPAEGTVGDWLDGRVSGLDDRLNNLKISDLLAHKSGLPAWRNFWICNLGKRKSAELADQFFRSQRIFDVLNRTASVINEKQGDVFRRDVTQAWLEVNGRSAPQATPPEATPPEAKPPEPKPPEPRAVAQQSRATKSTAPVVAEQDFAPPVKRFPFPAGVMITGGSGFIVDGGRKVVTNRHVIEDGKEFAIRTGLGEVIKVRVVFVSQSDDIAVLELEKALPADRAIPGGAYSKPRVGRNVVVMGYPLWYMLGEGSPSLTNGMVSKRTGLKDDLGTFQLTAKVNKGNSGGPVFDLFGNVVGITVGKLDNKKIQNDEGFIPEDVNFAIHVDRLPAIANAKVSSSESDGAELSTEELYQVMLGRVVMVATYK